MRSIKFSQKFLGVFIIIVLLAVSAFAVNAEVLVQEAINNVAKLETISLELTVELLAEGFNQNMVMQIESHLKEGVGRLEFKAPKEFAGQIIIVDKPKDLFINYYSTGQAVRMPLSQSAQANTMGMDISKLVELDTSDLSNLDATRYSFSSEETIKNGVAAYLITVVDQKKEFGTQKIWLAKSDKLPLAMESYDSMGKKIMAMTLSKVEKNKKLDLKKLRALPAGAVVFDM